MREKFILFAILFCVFVHSLYGQSAAQIKERYGQPIEAYSVSENIWMTPEFTDTGLVCSVRLYPKRITTTANILQHKLNYWELNKVIDQLAPLETRGKPDLIFGLGRLGGGVLTTMYMYDKISFVFLASNTPYFDPVDKDKPKENEIKPVKLTLEKSEDEVMQVPRDVEIVTITWRERECAKK